MCTTNDEYFVDDINLNIDNGKVTALTLLDLSAAFDTIDHDILITRLSTWYGISGTALSWFTSCLTDRQQAIKIGNCFSDMLPTSCGVPQGSVLGPLLFTLYTTPLSSVIQSHNLDHHLYADDTQIYVSLTTPDTCRSLNQLRDCLQDVSLWMKNSKLKLNADKTEFLIIGTSTQRAKLNGFFPTHILSQSITPATSVLNLGVTFDENFNFKKHISKTCRCCFYHIRDLRRIRRFLSLSVAKTIATALVSSRLDYCNSRLLQFQGHSQTSACPKLLSKGSHAFSSFFSLSAASKITALATCALSHHFQNVYNSLSSTLIYTTSISKFNANSNNKFQTATLNQ